MTEDFLPASVPNMPCRPAAPPTHLSLGTHLPVMTPCPLMRLAGMPSRHGADVVALHTRSRTSSDQPRHRERERGEDGVTALTAFYVLSVEYIGLERGLVPMFCKVVG